MSQPLPDTSPTPLRETPRDTPRERGYRRTGEVGRPTREKGQHHEVTPRSVVRLILAFRVDQRRVAVVSSRPVNLTLRAAAASLAVLALAACGSEPSTPPVTITPSVEFATPSASPAPWTAAIVSARRVVTGPAKAEVHGDTAWSSDVPAGSAIVTVRWSLAGKGAETEVPGVQLVHGAGKRPADAEPGWAGKDALLDPSAPTVVPASGAVETWQSWVVPTADLAKLELVVGGVLAAGEVRLPVTVK